MAQKSNSELEQVIRQAVHRFSSAKKEHQEEEVEYPVISTFNESIVDADTLMAELYLVLLNFLVCFVNLLCT